MKTVGIITVYNSLNCGSFLQSYALQTILEKNGFQAYLVDTKTRKPGKVTVAKIINALKKADAGLAVYLTREFMSYQKAVKQLHIMPLEEAKKRCDAFILGSDEIWNVKRTQMKKYPIFWGDGLDLSKTISYAPSVNNSKAEDLLEVPHFQDNVAALRAVSVRDKASVREIQKLLPDKEVTLCCDPTVLLEEKDYTALQSPVSVKDYLFVYDYDRIQQAEKESILQYAREAGLKLVIMGEQNWGDLRVPRDPYTFLSMMKNAACVVSGTFHGTLFAILNGKPLAAMARSNHKIYEILDEYGMSDRVFTAGEGRPLKEILGQKVDRDMVLEKLSRRRADGLAFLLKALDAEEKK